MSERLDQEIHIETRRYGNVTYILENGKAIATFYHKDRTVRLEGGYHE